MKSRKKRPLIIGLLCLVLLVGITIRIVAVNTNTYTVSQKIYSINEWVPLEGDFFSSADEKTDGYSIKVESAEFLTYEDFMSRFGKSEDYLADSSRQDVLLLKMDVKNEDNTDGGIFIRDCNIFNEQLSFFTSKAETYMKIANPNLDAKLEGITVRPGTEASIYWVYTFNQGIGRTNYLERNKGKDHLIMYLNVSLYPTRKMIKLNLDMTSLYS